jgi:hypothetical protein
MSYCWRLSIVAGVTTRPFTKGTRPSGDIATPGDACTGGGTYGGMHPGSPGGICLCVCDNNQCHNELPGKVDRCLLTRTCNMVW